MSDVKINIPMDRDQIDSKFKVIEQSLLIKDPYFGWGGTAIIMGIEIKWIPLPKSKGGNSKRGKTWGKITYSYLGDPLSRDGAISEALKPIGLRRALVEAAASIECSMCGKIVVGKDAIDPYRSTRFIQGQMHECKPWGLIFYGMKDYGLKQEPYYLNFCPQCLEDIANGEYKQE